MVVVKVGAKEPPEKLLDKGLIEIISRGFIRDGWLSMNSVVPLDALSNAQQEIKKYISGIEERNKSNRNLKVGDRRFMETINIYPPFNDDRLFAPPKVLQILTFLLGADLVLNSYTSVISLPGSQDQHVHQDGESLFNISIATQLPPHAITVAIPLVNIDALCGSTAIWERSHIEGDSALKDQNGILLPPQTPMVNVGDIYMFDYRVKHAGMANNSSFARPILYVVFSKPWWIDHQNFANQKPVNISSSGLESISPRIRSLFRLVEPL